MNKLLVVGSLNMDMILRVGSIPRAGETLLGTHSSYVPGGKGANQACAGGKLGCSVAMLGKVGDDAFGRVLTQGLVQSGVDVTGIKTCETETGLAVICVAQNGENNIVVIPGANTQCTAAFIRENEPLIAQSQVILLQMEIPQDAVFEAIRIAKKHGRTVILNPAPAPDRLPDDILRLIDYLIPNQTELERLSGLPAADVASAKDAAHALISLGVGCVISTLGDQGALYCDAVQSIISPAYHVTPVDTTAAGDTFCAAFALGVADGVPIEEALSFANAAAALSVTKHGAQPSIPTREETLAFQNRYKKENLE